MRRLPQKFAARPSGTGRPHQAPGSRAVVHQSPAYAVPTRELAGKWVAWSRDGRLVTSGDTLAEVKAFVEREGARGVSYEHLPEPGRIHSH